MRLIRFFAGTAAVCVGTVTAVDYAAPHWATVPPSTLLSRYATAQGTTYTNSMGAATTYYPVDMCEVEIPSDKMGPLTVDRFVKAFSSSPLFSLERRVHRLFGVTPSDFSSESHTHAVGDKMATLWTVESRGPNEVLFVWKSSIGAGATYFRVTEGPVTMLQLGSGEDLTSFGDLSSFGFLYTLATKFHYFHSKCLLLNTAAMIKWGGS